MSPSGIFSFSHSCFEIYARQMSNRAWATLSGLPAKETGWCEQALGNARLWVGESSPQGTASPSVSTSQPLARCSCPSSPTESPCVLSGADKRSHIQTPLAVSPPSSPITVASMGTLDTHMTQCNCHRAPGILRGVFGNANVWSPDLLLSILNPSLIEEACTLRSQFQ